MALQRILFVGPYPPPDNGTSIPFGSLIEFVGKHRSVDIVVINTQSGNKSGIPLHSSKAFIPFIRISFELFRKAWTCQKAIIYGSQRYIATIGALHALVLSFPLSKDVAIYIQGGAFDNYYKSLNPLGKFFVRTCLKRTRAVMVQTRLVHDALNSQLNNLHVVPNWANISKLAENRCDYFSENSIRSTNKPVRFVFIGNVIPEKGIVELVNAFVAATNILSQEQIPIKLAIYGPTSEPSKHLVMPFLESFPEGIEYHGYLAHDDLMSVLAGCDVLILPTWFPSEGYPGVIIEAMALGLPVIATRFRAIPELVIDGVNGLLCEVNDVSSLTDCILRIAEDSKLRHGMGNKAKETAKNLDASVVLQGFCRICGIPLQETPNAN